MMKAEQLVQEINRSNKHVESLKKVLKEIQNNCEHDYIEESAHRYCRLCSLTESSYY